VHPDNPQIMYAGTHHRDVYRTDDGGRIWLLLARDGVPTGP
jgi:hypothetical protein